ncbi:MAG: NADH-quinone oxidoreductase subunit L, partial [Alphaproteobacteria bacterium]|nr:NADH-quinone oxidoreductase subunit L [Alphaproteobacteria bacterium]
FYSKDMIIESAWAAGGGIGSYTFWLGVAAAGMTAFYSWRLVFMTFHGKPRASHEVMHHAHESPLVMTIPLGLLALGAVFSGMLFANYFVGDKVAAFWGSAIKVLPEHNLLEKAHHAPLWVKLAPVAMGVIGLLIAIQLYIRRTDLPAKFAKVNEDGYRFLLNKWYFDELFDLIFVRPAMWIGRFLWKQGDGKTIDGLGPDGIAASTLKLAKRASFLQSGYVYHYAFAMLIGVALIVTWYLVKMGGGS